jgi:hypothetical protein
MIPDEVVKAVVMISDNMDQVRHTIHCLEEINREVEFVNKQLESYETSSEEPNEFGLSGCVEPYDIYTEEHI